MPRSSLISRRLAAVGLLSILKNRSRWTSWSGVTLDRFRFSLSPTTLLLLLPVEIRRWLTSGEDVASASTLGDNALLLADSCCASGDFVTDSD